MEDVLLQNLIVSDPESSHHSQTVDIRIQKGMISTIAKGGSLKAKKGEALFEKEGTYLSPGWVDLQAHLSDPGHEYKEDISSLAKAAAFGGFTHVLAYPETIPILDTAQMAIAILQKAQDLPIHLHLAGVVTKKGEGKELAEMYDMHLAGVRAFTDGSHPVQHAGLRLRIMEYLKVFGGKLFTFPFDLSLAGSGQVNEGPFAAKLGMKGIPRLAEVVAAERDLRLLEYLEGPVHFQPITAPKVLDAVSKAKKNNDALTVGTTAFHLAFDDSVLESFDSYYKVFPPLRNAADLKLMKKFVKNGTIDAISSGHMAQGLEEKDMEFGLAEYGVLGLQTVFPLLNRSLVQEKHIDLGRMVELLSINPRKILGLDAATIEEGAIADLTLMNPGIEWTLKKSHISSQAKNSPLLDETLTGKVEGVYTKGRFHVNSEN